MSTTDRRRPLRHVVPLAALTLVVVAIAAYYLSIGQPSSAAGVLTGGLPFVVLASVALWRARRRPDSTGTAGRVLGGNPDERDRAIVMGSFAWTGIATVFALGVAMIAVALDADPVLVLRTFLVVVYVVFVGAFVVLSRRT